MIYFDNLSMSSRNQVNHPTFTFNIQVLRLTSPKPMSIISGASPPSNKELAPGQAEVQVCNFIQVLQHEQRLTGCKEKTLRLNCLSLLSALLFPFCSTVSILHD
jgi:hypothetical protein